MVLAGRSGSAVLMAAATTSAYATPALTMTMVSGNIVYRLPLAQGDKRFIDPNSDMTVKDNGTTKTKGTDYIVSGPCVIFNSAATGPVTIESFNYFATATAAMAKSFDVNVEYDVEELPLFESDGDPDNGWVRRMGNMSSATVDLETYWQDADILQNHTGSLFVFALYTDLTNNRRFEGYGYFTKDSIKDAADGVIGESLSLDVTGRVYYFSG